MPGKGPGHGQPAAASSASPGVSSAAKGVTPAAASPSNGEASSPPQEWCLDAWVHIKHDAIAFMGGRLAATNAASQTPEAIGQYETIGQILSYLPNDALLLLRCPQPRGAVGAHVPTRWHIKMLHTQTISHVTFLDEPPLDRIAPADLHATPDASAAAPIAPSSATRTSSTSAASASATAKASLTSTASSAKSVHPYRMIPLDTNKLAQREAKAVMQERKKMAQIGVNVSAAAQTLFDALAKTLPCQWRGQDIIVLDEVVIRGPSYEAKDVQLLAQPSNKQQNQGTLNRVRTIVARLK